LTTLVELTNRLGPGTPSVPVSKEHPPETPPSPLLEQRPPETTNLKRHSSFHSPLLEQKSPETTNLRLHHTFQSETSMNTSPSESSSLSTKLPSIPSFSEFMNSKKEKGNHANTSQNQSHIRLEKTGEKRLRLH